MNAADAIKARGQQPPPALNIKARKELQQLLAHNDKQTAPQARVGIETALLVLAEAGWAGSKILLDRLCQLEFKRKSYAKR